MDNQGLNRDDLERMERMYELRRKANESLSDYLEMQRDLLEVQRNITHIQKQNNKLTKELNDLRERENRLQHDTTDEGRAELELLRRRIAANEAYLAQGQEAIENAEKLRFTLSQALNNVNHLSMGTNTMVKGMKTVGIHAIKSSNYFLQQQKAVKITGFNMGILSKQTESFRNTIYSAALSTNEMGVDTKMLAQLQSDYSEGVGRAVQLNKEGLEAMGQIAAGTVLGIDATGQLAEDMDNFNVSATRSASLMEGMLNDAHKMGVNGAKVTRALANNVKMANRYHFKDGIKGMTRMANLATRFKLDMQTVGDFADKVFDVEGAVEMSSQLQVLGGNWSALADPFELMFKARNDMEGLTQDIIKATEVTGEFNKTTGEIQLSGMEMHRLREAAKITGIEYQQLADTAMEVAKNSEKMKQARGFVGSKEEMEYLNTLAQFDEKSGKFFVRIDGADINYDELHKLNKDTVKKLREEQATLKDRAKDAQTFDETWTNIKNTFKTALLPGFEAFAEGLSSGLGDFQKWMVDNKVIDKVVQIGKWVGEFMGGIIKWVAENPIKSMLAYGLFEAGKWVANGVALGMGFRSVVGGGGAGGIGGLGGLGAGTTAATLAGRGLSGKMGGFGKALAGKGVGLGLVGGLAGAGLDLGRQQMDDPNSGIGKAMGVGSTALQWGATGAMIGSVIPGLGTAAGAIIGGLAGAAKGAYDEGLFGNGMEKPQNDFIARPGAKPIPFSSADTLVGLKKDGGLGKALIEGGGKNGGNTTVTFGNSLKIEGKITVEGNGKNKDIDLDDPFIIRALTKLIQEELTKNLNGGKLRNNPI